MAAFNTSSSIAFVFPGQGCQSVGMGQSLLEDSPAAREVWSVFETSLPDLTDWCRNGPEERLKQTTIAQPSILAVSLAAWATFQAALPALQPCVTAGHSLGEYGALVAAGVMDASTALRVVVERARLMADAPEGAMAVSLGLPAATVQTVLDTLPGHAIVLANDNSPEQVVIAGDTSALPSALEALKQAGARRVMPLAVSGAFHSPLMAEAAASFDHFLADVPFAEARIPVITNVDATASLTGHRNKLAAQIDHPVRWTATMDCMVRQFGVQTVIEFGPGQVVSGLFKKAHRSVRTHAVYDAESLGQTVAILTAELENRPATLLA